MYTDQPDDGKQELDKEQWHKEDLNKEDLIAVTRIPSKIIWVT